MATIELFAAKINMMPDLIGEARRAVLDYKTELEAIRSKALAIDSSALDLSDIIASVKASTEILDRKAESLGELGDRVEQFVADVVRIDQGVAELIRLRKKEFYNAHPNLKPDSEKTGWEKMIGGLASIAEWGKEHWKLIVTVVLVIAAIVLLITGVGGPFAFIILGAAKGLLFGALVGGLMGGISSLAAGGSFWEGFEGGAFSGALTGMFFGGLGGLGQTLGSTCRLLQALGGVTKAIPYIAKTSTVISLGMAGFDLLSWGLGLFDPTNPITSLNRDLHQNDAYNAFQFSVTAVAAFTTGFEAGMQNPSCFVAGTLVLAAAGLVAIEDIKAGDLVASTDPETMETAYKRVVETYIREVKRLVHLTVAGGLISTTVDHPFYVRGRGFVNAGELAAGDELVGEGSKIHPIERAYHESTDQPVTVYNFQVEEFHTYHVGKASVVVHNACAEFTKKDDGSMEITDWGDYPEGFTKPKSSLRIVEGQEYSETRSITNSTNSFIQRNDPSAKGMQIHEIQPIKFGGSPTDLSNKVYLSPADHSKISGWWRSIQYQVTGK